MLIDQTVMCNNVHLGHCDPFSMLDCTYVYFSYSNELSILFTFEKSMFRIRIKIRQSSVSIQILVLVQALGIDVNLVHITLILCQELSSILSYLLEKIFSFSA